MRLPSRSPQGGGAHSGCRASSSARPELHPPHLATQILQSRSALEGERKQVTVLFCDLVGSTSLAERLGPETMHLLLNRFFELALSEVHRYEGTINQFLGDGFMALFGAPIAHEDHARRAALAALGLQKLLQEHRAELGEQDGMEREVRMGINTGWVVVGGIGDQLRRDYTAVGDTTNLAARLQQLAEPGTILVSEDASRLLQGAARLEPVGPLQVKGKEAPVQAFRLLSLGILQSEQAVLGGMARSPFVGRQREMATLEELRERAARGEGQVVGIAAEAGAGKSRLVYEFRRRLLEAPVRFLAGRCISYASGIPYLPILYMLRNKWGIAETDDPVTVAAKVTASLQRAGMDAEESLPYLLRLLGIQEGTEQLAELSPQALQARIFRILRQMILNAGPGKPGGPRDRGPALGGQDLGGFPRVSRGRAGRLPRAAAGNLSLRLPAALDREVLRHPGHSLAPDRTGEPGGRPVRSAAGRALGGAGRGRAGQGGGEPFLPGGADAVAAGASGCPGPRHDPGRGHGPDRPSAGGAQAASPDRCPSWAGSFPSPC